MGMKQVDRLFVSYSYVSLKDNETLTGFSNMVVTETLAAPWVDHQIDELEEIANQDCINKFEMDTAKSTVLWWKVMDGT